MLGTILIVILILALFGALPRWSHSRDWGYAPSGGVGLILCIVVILLVLGRIYAKGRSSPRIALGGGSLHGARAASFPPQTIAGVRLLWHASNSRFLYPHSVLALKKPFMSGALRARPGNCSTPSTLRVNRRTLSW